LCSSSHGSSADKPIQSRVVYLGNDQLLCRTAWDGYVVVPGYNIDVAIGIIRDGVIEPWTTRLVQELLKPAGTYVNVGANFGYFTALGGKIVGEKGKIYSYEANPTVFTYLMKTIFYSGIPHQTEAYQRAVYNSVDQKLEFAFDYQFIGGGHIKREGDSRFEQQKNPFWDTKSIPYLLDDKGKWVDTHALYNFFETTTTTLDHTIVEDQVDLILCDVELAEPHVILGGQKIIERSKECKLIFEWAGYAYEQGSTDYRNIVREMWDFLQDNQFGIRQLLPKINTDGSINVSNALSFEEFICAQHGVYVAIRKNDDPWS